MDFFGSILLIFDKIRQKNESFLLFTDFSVLPFYSLYNYIVRGYGGCI